MSNYRESHSVTMLPSGRVLLAAGLAGGSGGSTAALYDPSAGSWTAAGSLSDINDGQTATLQPNGKCAELAPAIEQ